MKERPLRTTVIGSYPFPSWLEFACQHLDQFGEADRAEMIDDAVAIAVRDQLDAGLDVITDGEQTRLDFNLSFYGFINGLELESASPRRFGPPAHDQRGKHKIIAPLAAPRGMGAVADFERLKRLTSSLECGGLTPLSISNAPKPSHLATDSDIQSGVKPPHSKTQQAPAGTLGPTRPALKASVPGPYTLSGRLLPNAQYADRYAITEALLPIVRTELEALVKAGCTEITVDEPSMSCYAHRENPKRFVDIFNRTVEGVRGKCRLSTHLCFGNYKGRAVGPRRYAPMFPAFLDFHVDEIHLEMASREFAELELLNLITRKTDAAVGIIDVKSYYIETPDDVASRVRACLQHAPADRLSFAPDCGLSQTARWAAQQKLANMVAGVAHVRKKL